VTLISIVSCFPLYGGATFISAIKSLTFRYWVALHGIAACHLFPVCPAFENSLSRIEILGAVQRNNLFAPRIRDRSHKEPREGTTKT
jgi:hypothetical protein